MIRHALCEFRPTALPEEYSSGKPKLHAGEMQAEANTSASAERGEQLLLLPRESVLAEEPGLVESTGVSTMSRDYD